jgi:thiosulfate/3-mercaptopyruvate sulfurtransferase
VLTVVAATFAAANGGDEPPAADTPLAAVSVPAVDLPSHLVDPSWLAENLEASNLVILDTARKTAEYDAGHVPGALYADRNDYWSEVDGIPGMFPGVEPAVVWLESLGISNESAVVIYDAGAGLWAARVAWTLAYLGHDDWAVLDGGFGLWDADDLETNSVTPTPVTGSFTAAVREELLVDGNDILADLDDPNLIVVDTRSAGEYEGSDVRADRGGHIPGAISIEWTMNNSDGSIPTFLSAEELSEFYTSEGVSSDKTVVAHCQTGVRGAHTWLALTLAGYDDVALYDASWAEWGNDEKFPVEE